MEGNFSSSKNAKLPTLDNHFFLTLSFTSALPFFFAAGRNGSLSRALSKTHVCNLLSFFSRGGKGIEGRDVSSSK